MANDEKEPIRRLVLRCRYSQEFEEEHATPKYQVIQARNLTSPVVGTVIRLEVLDDILAGGAIDVLIKEA